MCLLWRIDLKLPYCNIMGVMMTSDNSHAADEEDPWGNFAIETLIVCTHLSETNPTHQAIRFEL